MDQSINSHFAYGVFLISVSEINLTIFLFDFANYSHIVNLCNLGVPDFFIYGAFRQVNLNLSKINQNTSALNPSKTSLCLTFSAYSLKLSLIGITTTYLGLTKKGHFPAVCSVRIAINLSILPKIALWMITGLAKPIYKFLNLACFQYREWDRLFLYRIGQIGLVDWNLVEWCRINGVFSEHHITLCQFLGHRRLRRLN